VHVSPSTLGGIGSLVLYHLPAIAQAAHSFGFRICWRAGADLCPLRSAISRSETLRATTVDAQFRFAAANLRDIKNQMSAPARVFEQWKSRRLSKPESLRHLASQRGIDMARKSGYT